MTSFYGAIFIAGGLAILFVASPASGADAHGHLSVSVELDTCLDVRPELVRRIIAAELLADIVDPGSSTPTTTQVVADCHNPPVLIRVVDPITGKTLSRSLDLGEARNARTRLLALAIAELIWVSWTELETNPEPAVPPAGGRASAEDARKAVHVVELHTRGGSPLRTVVGAFFAVDAFAPGGALLLGGGARVGGERATGVGWAVDTRFEYGGVSRSEGHIAVVAGSAGAALFVGTTLSTLSLRMGGGLRVGLARVTGMPYSPNVVRGSSIEGAWGGPMLQPGLSLPLGPALLQVTSEVGYAVIPIEARIGGARTVGLDRLWFGGTLGCAF
jgi:hypothetical protein